MPLIIDDFNWRQTQEMVFIRVPLKGVPHNKVDLFTSNSFIKVHCPPYLFEACLYADVNEEESKCSLRSGEASFELRKADPSLDWPQLEKKDLTKSQRLELKREAVEAAHRKAEAEKKKRSEFRDWRRRQAITEQLAVEKEERRMIDGIKTKEKEEELRDIEEWKKKNDYDRLGLDFRKLPQQKYPQQQRLSTEGDIFCAKEKKEKVAEVPGVRKHATISVSFTARAFPTPSRESTLSQEQEWLKKQVEVRRSTGFMAEDLRPEENDPQWLLDKGLSFYKVGNYLAAVSAYTHGISLSKNMVQLYVARSSAQLALKNFRRAVADTSQALELLKPHVESNRVLRFESHYNRGQALFHLGLVRAAEADLEAALGLEPNHEECRKLFYKVELMDEPTEEQLPPRSYIESRDLI